MTFILPLIIILCSVLIVAMLGTEGMWSAALMLVNVILAGLLAMNFWEPAAAWLLSMYAGGEFFWDFLVLLGLFLVFLMLFRGITDKLSKKKVVFMKPVDIAGGVILSSLTGWIMACFLLTAAQTAPLAREFAFGGYLPEERAFLGTGPDRLWLAFVQRMSGGPLAPIGAPDDPNAPHVFDPKGEFILKYATHRERYASPESVDAGISGVVIPAAPPQ
jgi:hypothetical protein